MALAVLESSDYQISSQRLSDYVRLEQIVELKSCQNRDAALAQMLEHLADHHVIDDVSGIRQALIEREQHVSTAIGKGIALPHARLSTMRDFMICIGVYPPGICWGSCDHEKVKLIFMVLGPDDKQLEYLRMVAQIASLVHEDSTRKILLSLHHPQDVFKIIKNTNN